MKEFFTSLYIIIINIIMLYASIITIEWLVNIMNMPECRMCYLFVVIIIIVNSVYLITELIENKN